MFYLFVMNTTFCINNSYLNLSTSSECFYQFISRSKCLTFVILKQNQYIMQNHNTRGDHKCLFESKIKNLYKHRALPWFFFFGGGDGFLFCFCQVLKKAFYDYRKVPFLLNTKICRLNCIVPKRDSLNQNNSQCFRASK